MSHIAEEYAKSLGVRIGNPVFFTHFYPVLPEKFITFHTNSEKVPARHYDHWPIALNLIKDRLSPRGIKIVQVGGPKDPPFDQCDQNTLGASFRQMGYVIEKSMLHLGIDSLPVHMASALDIPIVALYSNIFPECSSPLWNVKSNIRCLSPDFSSIKPSFAVNESPKRVNEISPEEVASTVLDLLGINHDLNTYETLKIGQHYHNSVLEVVPDHPPAHGFSPQRVINLRGDLHLDIDLLSAWLRHEVNLMSASQVPLGILSRFKSRIKGMTLFLDEGSRNSSASDGERITEEYVRQVNNLGIQTVLICKDKNEVSSLRLKFFDWVVEEFTNSTKKDIDFNEKICDNTFYHSNKTLISKEKEYYSKASWKAGLEKSSDPLRLIDSEDFWEELEHLNIYNHEPERKTQEESSQ